MSTAVSNTTCTTPSLLPHCRPGAATAASRCWEDLQHTGAAAPGQQWGPTVVLTVDCGALLPAAHRRPAASQHSQAEAGTTGTSILRYRVRKDSLTEMSGMLSDLLHDAEPTGEGEGEVEVPVPMDVIGIPLFGWQGQGAGEGGATSAGTNLRYLVEDVEAIMSATLDWIEYHSQVGAAATTGKRNAPPTIPMPLQGRLKDCLSSWHRSFLYRLLRAEEAFAQELANLREEAASGKKPTLSYANIIKTEEKEAGDTRYHRLLVEVMMLSNFLKIDSLTHFTAAAYADCMHGKSTSEIAEWMGLGSGGGEAVHHVPYTYPSMKRDYGWTGIDCGGATSEREQRDDTGASSGANEGRGGGGRGRGSGRRASYRGGRGGGRGRGY